MAGAHLDELPDVTFTVHGLELEEGVLRNLQNQRKSHVWVTVDPLGKEYELGLNLRSRRMRAIHSRVGLSLHGRMPVEPSEPIWEHILEALRSEDEQDSDVYFVIRAAEAPDHPDGRARANTLRRAAEPRPR